MPLLVADLLRRQVCIRARFERRLNILQKQNLLAEDAVRCEPVSAPKFPANREINREFFDFGPKSESEPPIDEGNQRLPAEFPEKRNREFLEG